MSISDDIKKVDEAIKDVSYVAFEACQSRSEAREKRHFIIELVLILLLVITNASWLWYESQWETIKETTETVTTTIDASQDGAGTNIISGGDIEYGAEGKNNNNENHQD